jgi:hypothetical protein
VSGRGRILLFGTGAFAARIACDIAATASAPLSLSIAGRNEGRLAWLATACRARAATFGRDVEADAVTADFSSPERLAAVIASVRPSLVVQAASVQTAAVIAEAGTAWGRLVAEGGLSATAVFQALLSARVGRAMRQASPGVPLVNCCFPDVVNGMLAAAGLPVACGVGNVGILASCFGGALGPGGLARLRVLAHYQTIGAFRKPAAERDAHPPRVWIDGAEVAHVHARFAGVKLTPEPAIEVSGSASVPLLIAMARGAAEATAHVPGPHGLPGGYPVRWRNGTLSLDLPPDLGEAEAVAWNRAFEERNGLVIGADGRVAYTGRLRERLAALSPDLAGGFAMADLEAVHDAFAALRERLAAVS